MLRRIIAWVCKVLGIEPEWYFGPDDLRHHFDRAVVAGEEVEGVEVDLHDLQIMVQLVPAAGMASGGPWFHHKEDGRVHGRAVMTSARRNRFAVQLAAEDGDPRSVRQWVILHEVRHIVRLYNGMTRNWPGHS